VRQLKQFTVLKTGKAARHATETEPKLTCHQQTGRGMSPKTEQDLSKGATAKPGKWEKFKLSASGEMGENAAKQCHAR